MLRKCPRCELNYIREGEKLCRVCARELKVGLSEQEETIEMCSICGENPVLPGKDICAKCQREQEDPKKDNLSEYEDEENVLDEDVADLDVGDDLDFEVTDMPTTSLSDLEDEEFRRDEEEEEDF
jgi:hypothetical protein